MGDVNVGRCNGVVGDWGSCASKGCEWSPGIDSRGRRFQGKAKLVVGCSATDDDDDDDDYGDKVL